MSEEPQDTTKNPESVVCGATITGPKYGRLVAWRRQCKNKTKHPTGRCHLHRDRRPRLRRPLT